MEVQIKGVHYSISDTLRENIEKKLARLDYVKDHIVHFYFTIVKDSKDYKVEADIHFNWGKTSHVEVHDDNLYQAIDDLFDKIEIKATKEKDKVQTH